MYAGFIWPGHLSAWRYIQNNVVWHLLDATYKTTWYDMPLYFLCVSTNVVYVNVATMLYVMTKPTALRRHYEHITHLESRLASKVRNVRFQLSSDISHGGRVSRLSRYTVQVSPYTGAEKTSRQQSQQDSLLVNAGTHSRCQNSFCIRKGNFRHAQFWILEWGHIFQRIRKRTRGSLKKIRVPAFFGGGVIHSIVTTTNGWERQHEDLKHNYLTDSSNGLLADLSQLLWPNLFHRVNAGIINGMYTHFPSSGHTMPPYQCFCTTGRQSLCLLPRYLFTNILK